MNETEIQILGMSRSGNHAIIDWIFRQAVGRKLLLNCAEGRTNPFLSCRPLASGLGWRSEPELDIEAERAGRHSRKDLLIHSYEDSWLARAFSRELSENHDAWLGPSRRRIELLVLRDPYNLFASRLRMGCGVSPKVAQRMWKQHARVALRGAGKRLQGRVVLYNRWASDPAYRQELAGFLGIPFTDAGVDRVAECGGGSSFDGLTFDGQASAMPTDQRWRAYSEHSDFLDIFDDDMAEMSERLFGVAPFHDGEGGPDGRSQLLV